MTEGAFSAARRKISSSSFSPCQKYLQRKGTQEAEKKKKRGAKRNDEQSTKVRRKKRHISPYVVRGLGRSRWMSRSEPDLYSVLRWDCKIIHCYVRLSEQGLLLILRQGVRLSSKIIIARTVLGCKTRDSRQMSMMCVKFRYFHTNKILEQILKKKNDTSEVEVRT